MVTEGGQPVAEIESGDSVVFNFRPDWAIQLGTALSNPAFEGSRTAATIQKTSIVTFTVYSDDVLAEYCLQEG